MKKIFTALLLMIFVWGCAKKIAPSNSGAASNSGSSSNTQIMSADNNIGKGTSESSNATSAADQAPIANTGTFGTKEAPKELTGDAAAAVAGQSIFNAKCGKCHGLKVTTDYTAERWASILAVMAPKANLTVEERENVYAYVKANAKK